MIIKNLKKIEKGIGVVFKDKKLLEQAFLHRSYLNENPGLKLKHNERLEFLGDAVLELSVTDYLFNHYSNPEGELTIWRASLVNSKILAKIADKLGFNGFLLLSKGEHSDTGRARQFILANTFEAVVGAIFMDQGFEKADTFILKNVVKELPKILKEKLYIDPKSFFQEQSQSKAGVTPNYELIKSEGPDHDKIFEVGVYLEDSLIAKGKGPSKQQAQEDAAKKALAKKNWN